MYIFKASVIFVFFSLVFVGEILCFCEESYIVICDNLWDIKFNDTSRWKFVLIGSHEYIREPPDQILEYDVIRLLSYVNSLTIINQVNGIGTPFQSYNKLEYLNLYENDIKEIEEDTFQNFKKLKQIYLEKNRIEFMGRSVFKRLNLDVVSLSRNQIRRITTCFYDSNIKQLLINHNKLNYIKYNAFPKNLLQLELDHNELTELKEGVFENLKNLRELSVKHNRLTTFPNISSLKMIRFLHFSFNKIHTVNYQFEQNINLSYIDLTFNRIKKISLDIFGYVGKTAPIVKLNFNRLTNIKFENIWKKTDLTLYGNPWNCECLYDIEINRKKYNDSSSCEYEMREFILGKFPICIENGACDENNDIDDYDIDQFLQKFDNVVDQCIFYANEGDLK